MGERARASFDLLPKGAQPAMDERAHRGFKTGQLVLHDVPQDFDVDPEVLVDQDIS